jgi:putative transposase
MSNTYNQIYIQIIFAVKSRQNLINENHRIEIEKYICVIIDKHRCKSLSIYCNPDHVHILVSFSPDVSISELARLIKSNSSKFINDKNWFIGRFYWQEGFGAFSYSQSQIEDVKRYIKNQPEHHKKKSFRDEYITILEKYKIEYDSRYLFNWNE